MNGLVQGAMLAGVLSFCAGFFLPMWLMPTSNLGPIMGFIVAPLAALLGSVFGQSIASAESMSPFRATLIGLLIGLVSVVVLYRMDFSSLNSPEGYLTLACGALIFGITGCAVCIARDRPSKKPEEDQ